MEPYAVIQAGGKQYRVEKGDVVEVNRLAEESGASIALEVLAVSNGEALTFGTPSLDSGLVKADVLDHLRGKKLIAFKKKRRKGYKKKIGHRQELTKIKITDIAG